MPKSVSLDTIFNETSTSNKENIQIELAKDSNSTRKQHMKKDLFKEILDSHLNSFTYHHSNNSINAEQLLKVLQIVESFNRFMLLYKCVEKTELDFEKFTNSLLSNRSNENETEYFVNTVRTLILILLNEEKLSKCLLFNNKLSSNIMLNDPDYLSETVSIVIKMIDELQNDRTASSLLLKEKCYLLKNERKITQESSEETETDLRYFTVGRKIALCCTLMDYILEEGTTYRSKIDFLKVENSSLNSSISNLRTDVRNVRLKMLQQSNPALNDEYHSLSTNLKVLESQLSENMKALKNYCRISPTGRIKYIKSYLYFWRFKTFSSFLVIEKRTVQESEWYLIKDINTMLKIQANLIEMSGNMNDPLIKDLQSFIGKLQQNKEIGVNDFKFNADQVEKFDTNELNENNLDESNGTETEICDFNESVTISIMNDQNVFTNLRLFTIQLLSSNFVNISFKFDEDSLSSFQLNCKSVFSQATQRNNEINIESLKNLIVKIYSVIQKRSLRSKFIEIEDTWIQCCKEANTLKRLRFLFYFLNRNIKWSQSISNKKCEICSDTLNMNNNNHFKQICHKCESCFHLECVLSHQENCAKNTENKTFGLFKSTTANQLLCIKCFKAKQQKDHEAIELNEKKISSESKLEIYSVNNHSLRLRYRMKNDKKRSIDYDSSSSEDTSKRKRRLKNEDKDYDSDSSVESVKNRSKRKNRVKYDDEENNEDLTDESDIESKSKGRKPLFDRKQSEKIRSSLRPRKTPINYCLDFTNDFE